MVYTIEVLKKQNAQKDRTYMNKIHAEALKEDKKFNEQIKKQKDKLYK